MIIKLFDANIYHVLDKKYAFMTEEINQAIQLTIQERVKQESAKQVDSQ